jgi:hypothetical protein
VEKETDLVEKKLGDGVQAELMHTVHVYRKDVWVPCGGPVIDGGDLEEMVEVKLEQQEWVELHVDLLDVRQRQELCPFWGGAMSTRCDLSKALPPPPPSPLSTSRYLLL